MPTDQQIITIVKFVADGIDEVSARTKVMGDSLNAAGERLNTLCRVMGDARFGRFERDLASMNQKYEIMSARMRNVAAETARMDGTAAKYMRTVGALNAAHELTGMKLRNNVAAQELADGSGAKRMREVEKLNREHERTRRIMEYTARYGDKIGRFAEAHGGKLAMAGIGLAGVAGMGMGLARQGFQGTVSQAQYDHEQHMLGRQLAATMRPVMELMTKGARTIRERMERMGGSGQDMVMGGLLAGGTGAGLIAMRGASQMIGLVAGETMAARLRSGFLRAGVGMAGAGALGYGLMAGNVTSGAIGGAMLGGSFGGLPGAVIGGLAGGLGTQASLSPKSRLGESGMQYWRRMRTEEQKSWFGTYVAAQGEAISKAWDWATSSGDKKNRRDVQVSGGGYDAPGTAFERVNSKIATLEAEGAGAGGRAEEAAAATTANTEAMKNLTDAMRMIHEANRGSGGSTLSRLARPGSEP